MTALTSLLVLATLFTQVSASLPKTSYFKMVDIWLLFCIILIFFIIVFHTIIDLKVDYSNFQMFNPHTTAPQNAPWAIRTASPEITKEENGTAVIKVLPLAPGSATSGKSLGRKFSGYFQRLLRTDFGLDFYIKTSKVTMSTIFLAFNAIYWGTLAFDSGLVYYV